MLHCPQSLLKRSLHRSSKHTLQTLGISLKILLLCEETHYSLKERNRGNKAALVKRLKYLTPHPCQTASPPCQMIIGTETLFFWSRPNSVSKLQHGKNMNGAQAVWWLSHRDAKSRSLWSSTKGKCSVNQHCYISKCAFLQNYVIECSPRGGEWKILILRDECEHST